MRHTDPGDAIGAGHVAKQNRFGEGRVAFGDDGRRVTQRRLGSPQPHRHDRQPARGGIKSSDDVEDFHFGASIDFAFRRRVIAFTMVTWVNARSSP